MTLWAVCHRRSSANVKPPKTLLMNCLLDREAYVTSSLLQIGLEDIQTANSSEIVEGLDVGFTGYQSHILTSEFGKAQVWPITRRGIVSSVHDIGPSESALYLDYFYVDMIITKGGSGGPIYDARTGKILGMFKGYLPFQGTELSKGLSRCVPSWVIMSVWDKYLTDAKSRMEQNKK
jgi:hypothetical protein